MPQPLWNIEGLEIISQIVPKGHHSSESYAPLKTRGVDKDCASISKDVGFVTASVTIMKIPVARQFGAANTDPVR